MRLSASISNVIAAAHFAPLGQTIFECVIRYLLLVIIMANSSVSSITMKTLAIAISVCQSAVGKGLGAAAETRVRDRHRNLAAPWRWYADNRMYRRPGGIRQILTNVRAKQACKRQQAGELPPKWAPNDN